MVWMIFSVCGFIASILVAILYAFYDWFSEREWLEDILIRLAVVLVIPFMFVGCLFYEVLVKIYGDE